MIEHLENLIPISGVFLLVAYIDPGTGSMIIQVAIGFLLSMILALKVFWGRVSTWVKNIFARGKN